MTEYCLKINKVLKFNEVNKGTTLVDTNENFFKYGLYRINNLDVKNMDDPEYRLLIQIDRKCILRKFFGRGYIE